MAYDIMGNYTGPDEVTTGETEEERKKRLEKEAANTVTHKQEVTTYANGDQTRTTTQEIPASKASAVYSIPTQAAPVAQAAPVSPDTFARMQQVESGGRDYNAQGQPIVSPAGAMFKNQVMPATAANPGFGVTPAQAQTPEEYNRVGQEYYNAMLKKYGGNEQLASAAYNMGPGAVDRNIAQNQGQFNVAQAPKETQGYLGKVFGPIVNAVIPSAQAGELTPQQRNGAPTITQPAVPQAGQQPAPVSAPVNPAQAGLPKLEIDDQGNRTIINPNGTRQTFDAQGQPLLAGGQVPTNTEQYKSRLFTEIQNDPEKLAQVYKNKDQYGEVYSNLAGKQLASIMQQKFSEAEGKNQVTGLMTTVADPNASPQDKRRASNDIAKILQNDQGSWAKMILLGFISPDLAGAEAKKLGFGAKWDTVTDDKGNQALIKVRADGIPMEGYNAATGQAMSMNELAQFGGAIGGKKAHEMAAVHGSPVQRVNPETRQVETGLMMYDPQTKRSYVQVGNQRKDTAGWTTMAQTPTSVYNKEAAGAQGKAAGEGYTPTPVPAMPGVPGTGTQGIVGGQPVVNAPAIPSAPVQGGQVVQGNVPVTGGQVVAGPTGGTIAQQKQAEQINTAQAKERNQANQKYSDELAASRNTASAQRSTIDRLQTAIDKNPAFWGIDTNSPSWRAFVDINSKDADRAEALNTFARNLNIPKDKRAEFDQTMNDYRALQVNAITGSGLTASQTNTEKESQRVIGTIGSIADRPAAAKATLEYAKAKIEYTDAKARAWAEARRKNPGIDRLDFETNFDATQGEKIFKDANERMAKIIGGTAGPKEGETSTSRSGKPIVFRNGQWEYQ